MEPDQTNRRSINFRSYKPITYISGHELDIDRVDELIASQNGRLMFVRSQDRDYYQVLNLLTGKLTDLGIDKHEFKKFNAFRLLPLKDPLIVAILCRYEHEDIEIWSYQIADFFVDLERGELVRMSEWSNILQSFNESGSCFVSLNQLNFIFKTADARLKIRTFDIQRNQFCGDAITFQNHEGDHINLWHRREFKFRTYLDKYIYGFYRFNLQIDRTPKIEELIKCFSRISKRNIKNGRIQRDALNNTLRCLEIAREVYNNMSMFYIDGSWLGQRFHLHIKIETPASDLFPSNYFALLDLETYYWRPILINFSKFEAPIRMFTTSNHTLFFAQSYFGYEKDKKNSTGQLNYFVDLHQISLRKPESLRMLCTLNFNKKYGERVEMFDQYRKFFISSVKA